MDVDFAVIIQGESRYVELLKSAFKGYNTIFSTWEGEESKYSSDDKVIYNSLPRGEFGEYIFGPSNLNLQKISTINGLLLAKHLLEVKHKMKGGDKNVDTRADQERAWRPEPDDRLQGHRLPLRDAIPRCSC